MWLIKVGLVLAVCFVLVSSFPENSERKGKGKKPGKKPVKPIGGKKPAPGGNGSGEPSTGGKGSGAPSPGGKGKGKKPGKKPTGGKKPAPGGKGSGGMGSGKPSPGGKGSGSGMGLSTEWSGVWELLGQLKALLLELEAGGGENPVGSGSGMPPMGSGSGSGQVTSEPIDISWSFGMTPREMECIVTGTKVNFLWSSGHNVVELASQSDYDNCENFSSTSSSSGPFTFSAATPGTFYFACGIGAGFHCANGNMKAKITVADQC